VDPFLDQGPLIAATLASGAVLAAIAGVRSSAPSPLRALAGDAADALDQRPRGRGRRRDRARELHAEVPQLLDLLAAGSTAGLSAELSFRQAVTCLHGPLGDDLAAVVRRVDLGASWRSEMGTPIWYAR
jgi:Flp pilus assembly protein TadB